MTGLGICVDISRGGLINSVSGPGIHNGTHAEKSALGVGKVNLTYTHEEGDVMMHGGSFNLT